MLSIRIVPGLPQSMPLGEAFLQLDCGRLELDCHPLVGNVHPGLFLLHLDRSAVPVVCGPSVNRGVGID